VERFIKGEVVVVPFPFSDLTNSKRRPAFVLANLSGDDLILCQITSQNIKDSYAIPISEKDFEKGSLVKNSNVRPNRIFTADRGIVLYSVGKIKKEKITEIEDKVIQIIKG
jgi:mRNA interferase MazF